MKESTHTLFAPENIRHVAVESPCFIFSKDIVLKTFKEYQNYFPNSFVHFAMKSNSEPEILKLLMEEGSGFEVASKYELRMLKAIGVRPERIIFGASVKAADHIKEFHEYGVDRFAFDSVPEVEKIAAMAPGSRVYVRVSVNDDGSVFKFSEKFGTEKENIVPFLKLAKQLGLKPYGISFHVGSQAGNKMAWAHAINDIAPIIDELIAEGIHIEALDLGGGFPCNTYVSSSEDFTLDEIASATLEAYEKLPIRPKILLEPGRGIIANAGVVVASVIAKIERRGGTWLFLDAGVYNAVFETMAYQCSTRYRITSMEHAHDSGEMIYSIAGPTGDSPDIITHEAMLPRNIQVGDKVIIHDAGAYSTVCCSEFNGFPKPKVYYI